MKKVWLVMLGEQCEGGSCKSAWTTKRLAIAAAKDLALSDDVSFAGRWEKISDTLWEGGCDYIQVTDRKLQNKRPAK